MAIHSAEQENPPTSTSISGLATRFLNQVLWRRGQPDLPRPTKLPWESWDLNKEFFRALSQWTLQNPETTLERVLDNISSGLENSKDLLALIPESPFPARGLVTALGYLLKLGVMMSRAKRDVYEFSRGVVRWVGHVKSAFEFKEDGHFTRLAWKNLKDMRDLVNEICSWAVKRLGDRRWSRIGHGLMIQSEIQEFSERITSARALFQDLSVINLAKGFDVVMQEFDAIVQRFQDLSRRQQVIILEIRKIQKTQERQLDTIVNELESQKLTAERDRFLADALAGHTVAEPTYDKQGKRPCDPDTRVEVLAEIGKWINDVSLGTENFLWLTGDPGCGKSAITASVSKECKRRDILWAQFFINRNNVETTNPNSYFPSVAGQLARRSSHVADVLQLALKTDRTLTDGISADQAAKLFIDSIRCASQLDSTQPVVVVIDGLDETDRKRLEDTANIFSTLFTALAACNNVKVFISSRTENEIRNSFILPQYNNHVKRLHLDTADPSSIRDVSHYIKQNLTDLVRKHDLNWVVWPGDQRSRKLGERASGLFIWGVTVIKFIQERLQSDGKECLSDVLDLLTADVLHDINSLYTLILKVTYGPDPSQWDFERFRRIVGAIVFLQEPLCIDDLVALLDLRKTPSSDPVDIPHFVRRFRTILVTGTDVIDGSTIPRIHKSVFEFITSDGVSPQFRVNPEHAQLELGLQCLSQLGFSRVSINKDVLSMPFRYASRFWSSHLSYTTAMGPGMVCIDYRHFPIPPPTRYVSVACPIKIRYMSAEAQIQTIQGDYTTRWDALSGVNLLKHAGHVTCLAFSPDGRQVISSSFDKTIRAWDSLSGEWIRTIVEYSTPIRTIALSPDGQSIASGSDDGLIHVWDFSTGAALGQPFSGHKRGVQCVAFSPDAQQIVSGSADKTCILWNTQNAQQVGTPWLGHPNGVVSIVFSVNGRRVCSGDLGGYCFVWDVSTGNKIRSWMCGGWPNSMSFSPQNDEIVAVGSWRGAVISSDDNKLQIIPDSNPNQYVLFSSDGKQVTFATPNAVTIAEIDEEEHTGRIIAEGDYEGHPQVTSFALSPDLRYLAYASNKAVHIYTIKHDQTSLVIAPVVGQVSSINTSNGDYEVKDVLPDIREVKRNYTATNNRRLNEIKWYESAVRINGDADHTIKLLVLTDEAVIAAYGDGLLSIWHRHSLEATTPAESSLASSLEEQHT